MFISKLFLISVYFLFVFLFGQDDLCAGQAHLCCSTSHRRFHAGSSSDVDCENWGLGNVSDSKPVLELKNQYRCKIKYIWSCLNTLS